MLRVPMTADAQRFPVLRKDGKERRELGKSKISGVIRKGEFYGSVTLEVGRNDQVGITSSAQTD